jgi:hypothetical protein
MAFLRNRDQVAFRCVPAANWHGDASSPHNVVSSRQAFGHLPADRCGQGRWPVAASGRVDRGIFLVVTASPGAGHVGSRARNFRFSSMKTSPTAAMTRGSPSDIALGHIADATAPRQDQAELATPPSAPTSSTPHQSVRHLHSRTRWWLLHPLRKPSK